MKNRARNLFVALTLCATLNFPLASARAQGTAFTYQGRLQNNGSPASGMYSLQFSLYPSGTGGTPVAGPVTTSGVAVSNGLFTVIIDFGAAVWNGTTNWLQIGVEPSGGSTFTALAPRQQLTPVPYAIFAEGLSGLTVQTDTNGAPNLIGGSSLNYVSSGVIGATIGGGGAANYSGFTFSNNVTGSFGTVGGGGANTAAGLYATVGGGSGNTASSTAAAVAGGLDNLASGNEAVVSGGYFNRAGNAFAAVAGGAENIASGIGSFIGGGGYDGSSFSGNVNQASAATIGGGWGNFLSSSGPYGFIGGGYNNSISNGWATVAGGYGNIASGVGAFVGGGGYLGFNSPRPNVASGPASVVDGGWNNTASGELAAVGGGDYNVASGNDATVAGGESNTANGQYATVAGGYGNTAVLGAFVGGGGYDGFNYTPNAALGPDSVVGGGAGNTNTGSYGTIGGGYNNNLSGPYATVAGGYGNIALNLDATVGGGIFNQATNEDATVPGGSDNIAGGIGSFAAGYFALALHDSSFVWSDGENGTLGYSSDRANQFKIQAGGGVIMDVSGSSGLNPAALRVNSTSANGVGIFVSQHSSDATAVFTASGTGDIIKGFSGSTGGNLVFEVVNNGTVYSKGVALTSDRHAKEHFAAISPAEVLDKVAALPISEWNYKTDPPDQKHIGPMAQDFQAAFGLNGNDDKHISVVDEGGVALAAIQGLNQKLQEKDAEILDLKTRLDKLEQLLSAKTR